MSSLRKTGAPVRIKVKRTIPTLYLLKQAAEKGTVCSTRFVFGSSGNNDAARSTKFHEITNELVFSAYVRAVVSPDAGCLRDARCSIARAASLVATSVRCLSSSFGGRGSR